MILQRLVGYYDRVSADPTTAGTLPKAGYSLQKISFCIVLRPDGTLQQFQSLLDEGKKKSIPRLLLVPGQGKPSGSGINPCFLWDNSAYVLGFRLDDPKPERTRESFDAFRERHLAVNEQVNDPAFAAVCTFLRDWSPAKAIERAKELEAITGSFGVFKIAGEQSFVHDRPAVVAFWAGCDCAAQGGGGAKKAMCLVTGRDEPVATLHEPKIKGVFGAQSSGALLVSFNAKAYESFGKEQGDNAPVGTTAAFKYTNALNYLLSRRDRRFSLGDATVVFWAERPHPMEEVADAVWGDHAMPKPEDPPEDHQRAAQVNLFLSQLRAGHAGGDAIDPDSNVGFYVLGLSPNASRISVRFWEQSTVREMKQRLAQHIRDTELAGAPHDNAPLSIRRIVAASGRAEFSASGFKGYDTDSVSPVLAGAVARAVFTGNPYPAMLLIAMLNRLRADRIFSHTRLATIKACLLRNNKVEVSVSLNPDHASPAYHCGRLLCLLDYIQGQAIGNVNAGMVKKFYSVASCQPFAVFGRLIALTTKAHLPKLDSDDRPGFSQFCERILRQILSKIGDHFPHILTLAEQGEFALGFYHQKDELPDTPPKFTSTTDRGEKVRSKSEVVVANALFSLGINYLYENPLNIPGHRLIKPDFTVMGETPSETVYIEYLGLSDSPAYMSRWNEKLEAYRTGEILPESEGGGKHGRLVTFSETRTSGINSAEVKHRLKQIFGQE